MLIIIYVGAITVLFLFVIMMLDINVSIHKNANFGYLPILFLVCFLFSLETFVMFSNIFTSNYNLINQSFFSEKNVLYPYLIHHLDSITNIETIGQILYTYYAFFFLTAGIILLIALIGAVTLTRKETQKQSFLNKNVYKQISRNATKAVFNIQQQN